MRRVLLLFALLAPAWAQAADMIRLVYQDQDPGAPPYVTRMLVTPQYLRIDSGQGGGDFILLDRTAHKIYSVSHATRQILLLAQSPVSAQAPKPWKVESRVTTMRPGTVRQQILLNGKLCATLVATAKLFPGAVAAQQEYMQVLAAAQWRTWQNTPAELRDPCDLALQVLDIPAQFSAGLLLEEHDADGRTRSIQEEGRVPLDAALFVLPKGYQTVELGRLLTGGGGHQGALRRMRGASSPVS